MAKDLRKYTKPGAQGRGYGGNPGGHSGGHKPPKKEGCCPMVAAVKSVKQGKYKLARRYAAMSVRLMSARIGEWTYAR